MRLAKAVGANHNKWGGTRGNITFLGKGPTTNPLFQGPIEGLEGEVLSMTLQGQRRASVSDPMIGAIDDAMGYATAGKLNDIQLKALTLNLEGINKIYNPPVLPSAEVTAIAPGIGGLKRFPKESHKFFGRPLKDKDLAEIEKLIKEGKLKDARGKEWNFLNLGKQSKGPEYNPKFHHPESSYRNLQANQRTSARAAMIKLLDMTARGEKGVGVTLRELLSKQELKFLLEGGGGTKGDPLVLFNKYFGVDVAKHLPLDASPQTINAFTKKLMRMKDRGGNWFDEASFNPEEPVFAEGGLADILQVPRI